MRKKNHEPCLGREGEKKRGGRKGEYTFVSLYMCAGKMFLSRKKKKERGKKQGKRGKVRIKLPAALRSLTSAWNFKRGEREGGGKKGKGNRESSCQ